MKRERVEMVITGPTVSPEEVPLALLTQVLGRVEKAVLSYACARFPGHVPEEATVSLVDVRRGSEGLVFSVAEPLVPAVAGIAHALASDDLKGLPTATWEELHQLSSAVGARGWGFMIQALPERGIPEARLGLDGPLPPPPGPVFVQGTTTIHGRCLRVGGATQPRAEVRLTATGKLLNVDLSEEVAKQLAKRLYDEVVLEGQGSWDVETWTLEQFRVSHVADYHPSEPERAFRDLAEAAGARWEGVEAGEYVRSLRGDD